MNKATTTEERAPTSTPWGQPQHAKRLADGIWSVSTAGHGGIWLSDARLAELTELLGYEYPTFCGAANWFEEDCDWVIPVIAFRIADTYEFACKQLRGMTNWLDKDIYRRAYRALVKAGCILDHEKVKHEIASRFREEDCGGVFDGFNVTSDADPGL